MIGIVIALDGLIFAILAIGYNLHKDITHLEFTILQIDEKRSSKL